MTKPLLNHRDLMAAYNKGDIAAVASNLNRYQTIESDREWECMNGMPCRKKTYLVKHSKGVARWHVEYRRGEIKSVGCIFNVPEKAENKA